MPARLISRQGGCARGLCAPRSAGGRKHFAVVISRSARADRASARDPHGRAPHARRHHCEPRRLDAHDLLHVREALFVTSTLTPLQRVNETSRQGAPAVALRGLCFALGRALTSHQPTRSRLLCCAHLSPMGHMPFRWQGSALGHVPASGPHACRFDRLWCMQPWHCTPSMVPGAGGQGGGEAVVWGRCALCSAATATRQGWCRPSRFRRPTYSRNQTTS
jgi:hypothetical protein